MLDAHRQKPHSSTLVLKISDLVQGRIRGHELACHSLPSARLPSRGRIRADLDLATNAIYKAGGVRPRAYRAPGFSITASEMWAFSILAKYGYTADCSIFPARRAHGGMPNLRLHTPFRLINADGSQLISFPMNTKCVLNREFVFSGGGYFRLLPLEVLRSLFRADDYIMTYFHPRDFDPSQPIVPGLSLARKFKSYVGLSRSKEKLKELLLEFDFNTVHEAMSDIQSNDQTLKHVKITAQNELDF